MIFCGEEWRHKTCDTIWSVTTRDARLGAALRFRKLRMDIRVSKESEVSLRDQIALQVEFLTAKPKLEVVHSPLESSTNRVIIASNCKTTRAILRSILRDETLKFSFAVPEKRN